MHQAHQTAPARTAHDHEGRGDQQRAPAQRVSPLPPGVTRQPGTAAAPGPRPAATLSGAAAAQAAATAEPWQMAILVPEPVPPSIKAARDFTTGTLLDWGLPGLIQDATLVVSELVTNALRHGARDGHGSTEPDRPELILWARDGCLVCVVIDASASPPVRVPAGVAREDGRGLQVVQALASRWGWSMLGVHRKAVWAVLGGAEPGARRAAAPAVVAPA
jgi:anti-sigma regulatory factor (Ser/Thr protein kinase)